MMRTLSVIFLAAAVTSLRITAVMAHEIINGRKASENAFQYMASLQANKTHHCGGFLIAPKYVLTAAQCDTSEHITVVLGQHNIDPRRNLERYEVLRKFKPKPFAGVQKGDDIMLLKLRREVLLGEKVKTVNFTDAQHRVPRGTSCVVAGWGKTNSYGQVNELLALNVSAVDIHECRAAWKKYKNAIPRLPPNIICAGGYKHDSGVCKHDSGGPLVCDSVAVGIVSLFNQKCKYPDVPNIYTDISKYSHWIRAKISG